MRPRGSVWLSARKPPDITGVALTLQIRPRRPRQQARGGPGRPGLPRQHRQRARPGPKTQTPGVPPRPLLPLGAAGPWVGGGGDSLQVSSSLRPARSCGSYVSLPLEHLLRAPPRAPVHLPSLVWVSVLFITLLSNYSTHTSQRSASAQTDPKTISSHVLSPLEGRYDCRRRTARAQRATPSATTEQTGQHTKRGERQPSTRRRDARGGGRH